MLKIKYSSDGKPVGDLDAIPWLDGVIERGEKSVHVSTYNVIQAVKFLIMDGRLDHSEVAIWIDGIEVGIAGEQPTILESRAEWIKKQQAMIALRGW